MINPRSKTPPYLQVAADLRTKIRAGDYGPGDKLPPFSTMAHEYGVGIGTVTRAVQRLRTEGLIDLGRASGAYVRDPWPRKTATIPTGATLIARMPTPAEQEAHDIEDGVPVIEVRQASTVTVYPADRWRFTPG
jgi:GntR family transcriptional regulator